jgi:hypothetical protein
VVVAPVCTISTNPPAALSADEEVISRALPAANKLAEIATALPAVNASAVKLAAPAAVFVVAVVDTTSVGAA